MKIHYKIFGNINKNYLELNLDLTRWLLGFGWYLKKLKYVHINLGPFAIIYIGRKLEKTRNRIGGIDCNKPNDWKYLGHTDKT